MIIPKEVEFKTDEWGESLYIDGQEVFTDGGSEDFEVPFFLVRDAHLASIPAGIKVTLCDYIVGTTELYSRSPSAIFENSSENGIIVHLETPFFSESETMELDERQQYFREAINAARTSLEPLINNGRIIKIEHRVYEEIAYLHCTVKIPNQTFSDAEEHVTDIEERIISAHVLPTLFICYASEDREFVDRLIEALDRYALHIWYDKREIIVGESIVSRVNEGLRQADFLIAVLSSQSIRKPWVQRELYSSLMRQLQEKKITVLPILIDECDIPELVADIKYADFRISFDLGLNNLITSIRRRVRAEKAI